MKLSIRIESRIIYFICIYYETTYVISIFWTIRVLHKRSSCSLIDNAIIRCGKHFLNELDASI